MRLLHLLPPLEVKFYQDFFVFKHHFVFCLCRSARWLSSSLPLVSLSVSVSDRHTLSLQSLSSSPSLSLFPFDWQGVPIAQQMDQRVAFCKLQRTATHCNALQHTAIHCNSAICSADGSMCSFWRGLGASCVFDRNSVQPQFKAARDCKTRTSSLLEKETCFHRLCFVVWSMSISPITTRWRDKTIVKNNKNECNDKKMARKWQGCVSSCHFLKRALSFFLSFLFLPFFLSFSCVKPRRTPVLAPVSHS